MTTYADGARLFAVLDRYLTRRQALVGVALTMLLGTACGALRGEHTGTLEGHDSAVVYRIKDASTHERKPPGNHADSAADVAMSRARVDSLDQLVARSELIVIATVQGKGNVINAESDVIDRTKPSPYYFTVGQVYHIRVSRALKGTISADSKLNLLMNEGIMGKRVTGSITEEMIEKVREQSRTQGFHKELVPGNMYIMFLRPWPLDNYRYYMIAAPPGLILLRPNGRAELEIGSLDMQAKYPPQPATEFIAEVERLIAAGVMATTTAIAPASPIPTSDTSAPVSSSAIVGSLGQRVVRSSIIVIGHVQGRGGVVNLATDQIDHAKPERRFFAIGQVYQVTVERYLKGSGPDTIELLQDQGIVREGTPVTQESIEQAHARSTYIPMQPGARYLFFLYRAELYGKTYYASDYYPGRYALPEGGIARIEAAPGFERGFPAMPSAELITEVERLIQAGPAAVTPTATPVPPTRVPPTATPFPTPLPTKTPTPVPVMPVETFIPSPVPTETPVITPTFPPDPPLSSTWVPGEEPRPQVPERDLPPAKP
jgi:hypothetical protein